MTICTFKNFNFKAKISQKRAGQICKFHVAFEKIDLTIEMLQTISVFFIVILLLIDNLPMS